MKIHNEPVDHGTLEQILAGMLNVTSREELLEYWQSHHRCDVCQATITTDAQSFSDACLMLYDRLTKLSEVSNSEQTRQIVADWAKGAYRVVHDDPPQDPAGLMGNHTILLLHDLATTMLTPFDPAMIIRADIMSSVCRWRDAGTALTEWRNLLGNPKTADLLGSMAHDLEEFLTYFRAMATFLGLDNDSLQFVWLYEAGPERLKSKANDENLAIAMGARLLLKFRAPQPTAEQRASMRFGVPGPLVVKSGLQMHG